MGSGDAVPLGAMGAMAQGATELRIRPFSTKGQTQRGQPAGGEIHSREGFAGSDTFDPRGGSLE